MEIITRSNGFDKKGTIVHKLKTSFGPLINYSYFIQYGGTNEVIIVDPAWEVEKIKEFVRSRSLQVKGIFLTHSHIDHSNLADELSIFYNCHVYITAIEASVYDFTCTNIVYIHTEDDIIIGNFCVKPVFSPGHTKGGCCYLVGNAFFTGDTLFIEGCGTCTDYGADPQEMFYSLQKIKSILHGDHKIYPGHRYRYELGISFSEVIKSNIYLQIEDLNYFVKFRMRPNQRGHFNFT